MRSRACFFFFVVLSGLFFSSGWPPLSEAEGVPERVIILGFDGVDPTLLERWMDEGELPNLASLRRSGTYLHLGTTLPPQSPVSWAVFSTGMNPGKTRIFDFLHRTPGSYLPDFAMLGEGTLTIFPHPLKRLGASAAFGLVWFGVLFFLLRRKRHRILFSGGIGLLGLTSFLFLWQWIPPKIPKPFSRKEGHSFWQRASEKGIRSVVIRVPANFPPEPVSGGRLLSGLGVPDVRKTFGTFSFYTTEPLPLSDTEMGGKIIPVRFRGNEVKTFVWGPKDFTKPGQPDLRPELGLSVHPETGECIIRFQGKSYTVREGEWSPWVHFRFDLNPLLHLDAIGRFYLLEISPVFRLYLSPIQFHPSRLPPNISLSFPRNFSGHLAGAVGLYKTIGWLQETWGLNEERLDEEGFLKDLFQTEKQLEEIMLHELEKGDWRLFVGVFEGTDRIQHMYWRTLDPVHPAYSAELASRYGDVILKSYREMDETVGRVLERFVDEETVLFILSDHGFRSYRVNVNLNTWLVEEGYLVLKGMGDIRDRNLEDLFNQGEFWPNVDWSRTRAYALGLTGMYINLKGREPEGIVSREEYDAVRGQLVQDLLSLKDPKTETHPILNVYRREEVYSGPYLEEAPDLILGFADGYRVSWQTALGGIPAEIFEENNRKWSGDHCSYDPSVTSGIFFCNRKVDRDALQIMDLAPTVLEIFGVGIPSEMDGKSFWKSVASGQN